MKTKKWHEIRLHSLPATLRQELMDHMVRHGAYEDLLRAHVAKIHGLDPDHVLITMRKLDRIAWAEDSDVRDDT